MTRAPRPNHRVTLQVRRKWQCADGIWRFDLADPDDWPLPPFSCGAHVDLHLPGGRVRQYSLCGDPAQARLWSIAVLRDTGGRGGSVALCDEVAVGDRVLASLPRSAFPLADAPSHLMIAGGIGITPFLSMLPVVARLGQRARLVYTTRTAAETAGLDELRAHGPWLDLTLSHSRGDGGARIDVPALLAGLDAQTAVYACGPVSLLETVQAAGAHLGPRLRIERFGPAVATDQAAYSVEIAETGQVIAVRPGQTMLDALRQAGLDLPASCEAGICLDCKTRHLAGRIEHRDIFLSPQDRQTHLTPCVSHGACERIVLSLPAPAD